MSTIKDVARLAGVGVATASRALSGRGSVSVQAQEKVRQAVATLDYRPSAIAQALSLQQSGAIGMYVPAVNDSFYAAILEHADRVLRAHGRHLIVVTGISGGDARVQALDAVDFLLGRDCDGLIISGYHLSTSDVLALRKRQPHLALVNRGSPRMRLQAIEVDHVRGGALAAQVLLSHGHRHIALVLGPDSAQDNRDRVQGFREELARHGLAPILELPGDFSRDAGYQAGEWLAQQIPRDGAPEQRCTAVFCANDRMASGLIASLGSHGWQLPQALSVVGYDNDDLAPYVTPSLTTIRIPIGLMAESAAAYLLNDCYGLDLPVQRHFEAEVVWRRSVQHGPFEPMCPVPGVPADRTHFFHAR